MAIRPKTIEERGEKQVIVMAASETFNEVRDQFLERKYAENEAYLVVRYGNGQVGVISFLELAQVLGVMRPNRLDFRLSALPIPPASRVIEGERSEGGLEMVQWVAAHAGSTVVVVDEAGDFVCLFTNVNRAGLLRSLLSRLHGQLGTLYNDARATPFRREQVATIATPDCDHEDAYLYDIERNRYLCPACKKKVNQS